MLQDTLDIIFDALYVSVMGAICTSIVLVPAIISGVLS